MSKQKKTLSERIITLTSSGGASKKAIAKKLGVSYSAVSRVVNDLVASGALLKTTKKPNGIGRPASIFKAS